MIDTRSIELSRRHWDSIAKPLGSLGILEDMIAQIAGIQHNPDVDIAKRCALVFCADNGVVCEGVSQSGSEVTALVAKSIASGTANISAMARVAGADVIAVDIGMAVDVDHPALLRRKVAYGTGNIAEGPAMSREQALEALEIGASLVGDAARRGYRAIATGEMGIANTTTSSAVASVLLSRPVREMTGRGAGLSGAGLERKVAAIERAIGVNHPDPADPLDVLAKLGGYDIAGMAGAFLGGMRHGVPVVIDGFISGVAALIAARIEPGAVEYMLASHISREPAGRAPLNALSFKPVICAEMALGEGTGAVALFPLLDMALSVYRQNSTFEAIQVEAYQRFEDNTQ